MMHTDPPGPGPVSQPPGLDELIRRLDAAAGPIAIAELARLLGEATLSLDDLAGFIRFDPGRYADNPIRRTAHYELSCMCWEPGQSSPAHDHRGSTCCVRVLQGVLTNIAYGPSSSPHEGRPGTLHVGDLLAMQDTQTHRLSNQRPPGDRLITLHVYSPPLLPASEREVSLPDEHREAPLQATREAPAGRGREGEGEGERSDGSRPRA